MRGLVSGFGNCFSRFPQVGRQLLRLDRECGGHWRTHALSPRGLCDLDAFLADLLFELIEFLGQLVESLEHFFFLVGGRHTLRAWSRSATGKRHKRARTDRTKRCIGRSS